MIPASLLEVKVVVVSRCLVGGGIMTAPPHTIRRLAQAVWAMGPVDGRCARTLCAITGLISSVCVHRGEGASPTGTERHSA